MKRLYAPWRSEYTKQAEQGKTNFASQQECVFCQQFAAHEDDQFFILKRTQNHVIVLNKYPYNAGHLLILPVTHIATLADLSQTARAELMELTNECITILQKAIDPQGFNIGINLGKAAGAGIPSHLHMHVLPRFHGDTNFLPTLGETKQISMDLHELFLTLKPYFD